MITVAADGVGKRYCRYSDDRTWTLQEAILSGFRHLKPTEYFWSLRNISFTVTRGSALGVIGRNGAGKSTLLRLLGGIGKPDEGSVSFRGRIGGLLELTAGFHPDLTGRENAFIGGVLRGLTRAEVAERFQSVVEFAELQEYIDRPLRTYSTGMQMRLAFGVAIQCEPDILLVDEVLAVGDIEFQRKCLDRIAGLRARGCTIVLVSHDAGLVKDMCDHALWLKRGVVEAYGPATHVVDDYVGAFRNATARKTETDMPPLVTSQGAVLRAGQNRFGSMEVSIRDLRVYTDSDTSGLELSAGGMMTIEIDYMANATVERPVFGITILHHDGRICFNATSEGGDYEVGESPCMGHITIRVESANLEPGTYFVDVGIYEKDWKYAYDYHARSYPVVVRHTPATGLPQPNSGQQMRAVWIYNQGTLPPLLAEVNQEETCQPPT